MPLACSWKPNLEKSGAYHGYVLHRSLRNTAADVMAVFLSSYDMPKTPPATVLLFGLVTLLCGLKCGTFLFYLMSDRSVLLSDWTPSDQHTPVPSVGFSGQSDSVSPLLHLFYIHRRIRGKTKLSPLSQYEVCLTDSETEYWCKILPWKVWMVLVSQCCSTTRTNWKCRSNTYL